MAIPYSPNRNAMSRAAHHAPQNTAQQEPFQELLPSSQEDDSNAFMLTPEIEARLAEAREAYAEGNYISCKNLDELRDFLDHL